MSQAPKQPDTAKAEGAQLQSVAGRLNAFQSTGARDQRLNELSQELTNMLFILFRSAGLYDLENKALDQAYEGMLKAIMSFYELTRAAPTMRVVEENIFINRRQVKLDFSTFQNVRALVKIFSFLEINELSFEPEVTREDLALLLQTFVKIVRARGGSIRDEPLRHIRARQLKIGRVHKLLLSEGHAERVCAWYAIALSDTRAFYSDAAKGRVPSFPTLKRVAQTLIELPEPCAPLLSCLHLLTPPELKGSLTQQSVEAASLCLTLCLALQLDAEVNAKLSLAALQLFQGWTLIEGGVEIGAQGGGAKVFELLESRGRSGALSDDRRLITRQMLDLGGVSEAVIERVVMIYEAQISLERRRPEGQQSRPSKAKARSELYPGGLSQGLLTELALSAHLYAHLREAHGPSEAMRRLRSSALSPLCVRVYERAFGELPVGSSVTLSDGQRGVVLQTSAGAPSQVLRVRRSEGRLEVGERLTLDPSSPIQVQSEGDLDLKLIAPIIFSHRSPQ